MKFIIQKIDGDIKFDFQLELINSIDAHNFYHPDDKIEIKYGEFLEKIDNPEEFCPIGSVEYVLNFFKIHFGDESIPRPINVPYKLMDYTFTKRYIDNITIEKTADYIKIVNGNFRESYLKDIRTNHDDYGIPYNFNIFEDDYGYKLNMNHEVRTKEEAKKYFDKLCKIMSDYKFNYYVIDTDDDLKNIKFSSDVEIEKIIRLIALKPDKKYKNQNLKLGVITIDLTDIKDKNGNQLYKDFFVKLKEVNKNELCNI